MKYQSCLASLFLLLMVACTQEGVINPDTSGKFIKFFGGANDETAYAAEQTANGSFVIVGSTKSFGKGGKDIYFIRADANGNQQDTATYGGAFDDAGRSITVAADGTVFILGYTTTQQTPLERKCLLLKFNDTTNRLDTVSSFGKAGTQEEGYFLNFAANGDHLLVGSSQELQEQTVLLIRTDPNGIKKYDRSYGLIGKIDSVGVVREAHDQKLVWCGTANRGNSSDMRLVVSDAFGNLISDTPYGAIDSNESGKDFQKLANGYVAVGTSIKNNSSDIFLVTTKLDGAQVWTKLLKTDSKTPQSNLTGNSVFVTQDNGFIITGSIQNNSSDTDILLLKTNFSGEVQWVKTFGGSGNDNGTFVKQTLDGGYMILATVRIENNDVISLIKTDANGESVSGLAK